MRVIISNQNIELTFDEYSGELRELTYLKTGENIIKNYIWERKTPFNLLISNTNGEKETVTPPLYDDIAQDILLKPELTLSADENGINCLIIDYKYLKSKSGKVNICAKVKVKLAPDNYESLWGMDIANQEEGYIVEEVVFPFISGVYFGDTWKDDTLIFPSWSAIKVPDPTAALSLPPVNIGWRWHDYNYGYRLGMSVPAAKMQDGSYLLKSFHSGSASMNWMSCYGDEFGLYMAAYQDDFKATSLGAETFGNERPGMGFCFTAYPHLSSGDTWSSKTYGIALHPGDWHWGADRYREWRNGICTGINHRNPQWFDKSAGLIAHYDFKYQHQFMKPVHKYQDIRNLYEEAKEIGISHLLISGWHKDGFDRGFPRYRYEPELGSEKEFSDQVKNVVNDGGHVSFYVNSRLFNRKYISDLPEVWENGVAIKKDNSTHDENYGSEKFSVMCASAKAWQDHLFDTVKYLAEEIRADGVYLDQLNCSAPVLCFNSKHNHSHDEWNNGYNKLLDRINTYSAENLGNPFSIICEGASDIHGCKISGHLISTFINEEYGAFPEAYKYTFPEETLVDMIYPSKGRQVMRPVHVSRSAYMRLERAFLTGCYFWIYDLEGENTFKADPEMTQYLKDVISLRKLWLEKFGRSIYRDDRGIIDSSENVTAKVYQTNNKDLLIAVCNSDPEKECRLLLDTAGRKPELCTVYQLGGDEKDIIEICPQFEGENISLIMFTKRLSLIYLSLS